MIQFLTSRVMEMVGNPLVNKFGEKLNDLGKQV